MANFTGPMQPLTIGGLLDTAVAALGPPGTALRWVDEAWLPRAQAGMHAVSVARAVATGLACRPLADTLRDTAAWLAAHALTTAVPGGPARPAVGLAPEREAALLEAAPAR